MTAETTVTLNVDELNVLVALLRAEADRLMALATAEGVSREDEDRYLVARLSITELRDRLIEATPLTDPFWAQFAK